MLFSESIFTNFINFLIKFFEDSFINLWPETNVFEVADLIIVLFWSTLLSMIIAITYRGTHRSVSYSQNFTQTLVILGVIVSTVMLIIGTSIARAFTLVGALSIVRFRTALKDTRDIGFIFFVMVIGMACGTRFFYLAILVTLVVCLLTYYMTIKEFGKKELSQDILELDFPISENFAEILSPIFISHLKYYSILGIDSVDERINHISFLITFKKVSNISSKIPLLKKRAGNNPSLSPKAALLNEIQKIKFISNLKIIEGSNSVEI